MRIGIPDRIVGSQSGDELVDIRPAVIDRTSEELVETPLLRRIASEFAGMRGCDAADRLSNHAKAKDVRVRGHPLETLRAKLLRRLQDVAPPVMNVGHDIVF